MKNNFFKKYLLSTALSAISVCSNTSALETRHIIGNGLDTKLSIIDPFKSRDYVFAIDKGRFLKPNLVPSNNASLTINHGDIPGTILKLPINSVDIFGSSGSKIIVSEFWHDDFHIKEEYVIVSLKNSGDQSKKVDIEFTADSKLTFVKGTGTGDQSKISTVDFANEDGDLEFKGASEIQSVRSNQSYGTILVTGKDNNPASLIINNESLGIDSFKTDYNGASLTIKGKSKAKHYVAAGASTINIQNDSDASSNDQSQGYILEGDRSKIIFGSTGLVESKGDVLFQNNNTELVFQGLCTILKGDIKGNSGLSNTKLSVNDTEVNLVGDLGVSDFIIDSVIVKGRAPLTKLHLQGNSKAKSYQYTGGAGLWLDSTLSNIIHTGTFRADDKTSWLRTSGPKDVTIEGSIDNGMLLVGTDTNARTVVHGNIGKTDIVDIQFVDNSTLEAKDGISNATVDFDSFKGILQLNRSSAIQSIKGDGSIISGPDNIDVILLSDSDIDNMRGNINFLVTDKTINVKNRANIAKFSIRGNSILNIKGQSSTQTGYIADDNSTMNISSDSSGSYIIKKSGNITFDATNNNIIAKGDATLSGSDTQLVFSANNGSTIEFNGKIQSSDGMGVTKLLNVSLDMKNDIESDINSTNSILTLDSSNKLVTYNKKFIGDDISKNKIITAGANDIALSGGITNAQLSVATSSTSKTIINDGDFNNLPINFASTTTLELNSNIQNPVIDFAQFPSTIQVSKDFVFNNIINANHSTIKTLSDNQISIGYIGSLDKLLNLDASSSKDGVTLTNTGSYFNDIDTGVGSLRYQSQNNPIEIFVHNIKGNSIIINNQDLIINPLNEHGVIKSDMVEFASNNKLTIKDDFGNFDSKVQANNNGTLEFVGSGSISSSKIGQAEKALSNLNIAHNIEDVVSLEIKESDSHYITNLHSGAGTTELNSNYNLIGDMHVAENGNVNLKQYQLHLGTDKKANILALSHMSNVIIGDGGKIIGDISFLEDPEKEDNHFIFTIDATEFPKDGLVIVERKDGENLSIRTKSVTLKSDNTALFASSYSFHLFNSKQEIVKDNEPGIEGRILRTVDISAAYPYIPMVDDDYQNLFLSFIQKTENGYDQDAAKIIDRVASSKNPDNSLSYMSRMRPKYHYNHSSHIVRNQTQFSRDIALRQFSPAAGDDVNNGLAMWVKAIGGKGYKTSSGKKSAPYNSSLLGFAFGLDFPLGDHMIVGMAGSYADTDIDYTQLQQGDKENLKSMFVSIYGSAHLNNNIILSSNMIFGNSDITGTMFNPLDGSVSNREATRAISYGGSLTGGYRKSFDDFSLTPIVGIGFNAYSTPAIKTIYGMGTAPLSDDSHIDLIAGMSFDWDIKQSNFTLVPELHGFYYHNITGNQNQKSIDIQGIQDNSVPYTSTYTNIANFVVGASLNLKHGMVECITSLDGQFAHNYKGFLGSIKLKLNL